MKKLPLILLSVFSVSACTSPLLRTTHFPDKPNKDKSIPGLYSPRIGIPYYLPTALIPITINLDQPPPKDSAKNPSTKNGTATSASGGATTKINPPPKDSAPTSPPKDSAPGSSSLISQKIGPYNVTIGAPVLVPDTSKVFFLEYNPSFATEDAITFGVGENQLLQSINATSTDKSGEVLVTLAKIAADVAMLAGGRKRPVKSLRLVQRQRSLGLSIYLPTLIRRYLLIIIINRRILTSPLFLKTLYTISSAQKRITLS